MRTYTFSNFNFKYYSRHHYDTDKGRSYYETARLAFQAAQAVADRIKAGEPCDGLLITGRVGSGKTFLACCIANAVLDAGKEALFLVVPDFLDRIRATYDGGQDELTERDLLDTAREVQLLILDDLGAHQYTPWAQQKLYSILNHRLNYRLPTVVTTNLDLEELNTYLGERTTSRLVQMCRVCRLAVDVDIRIAARREVQGP
ncbi:MAG: ATP-binding protein [Bacillota bacterium]